MASARSVLLNLIGNDRVSRTLRRVRREVEETAESVDRFGSRAAPALGAVTRSIGRVVKVGAKFASIGLGAALAISQALQLAAALAPLAGLAAGIPAAAGLAAAAFGTLRLALSGVSEAFQSALGDDAEKFEESLKGLAPAAQSVARELRALRPTLLGIRNAAQAAFFGPLQGQLRATAAVLAGPLRSGVRGVAAEYGLAAAGALRFARQGRTASALTAIFAATRQAIAGIRPAIEPVLAGFRDMAVQGVGTLSKLAAGAGNVGVRFGEWMQRFAASGGVQRALEGALGVVRALGGLLLNVGGILSSIFQAASSQGGGLLGFLGQAVAQLNAFLKTAQAQAALRSFFATMNQLGAALAPIVPIVGRLAAQLITALAPVVRALTPLISMLVGALGRVLRSLTPLLAPLSALIVSLISGLMPVLGPIVTLIADTAAQIGGALVQALVACMPSIRQLVLSAATLLPTWAKLTPLFASLVVAILPLIPPVLRLATILVTALVPVLTVVIGILVKYWSTIIGLVIPVITRLVAAVTWLAGIVQPVFSGIWAVIQTLGRIVMWVWTNAIRPAFTFIATLAKWLFSIVAVAVIGPLILQVRAVAAVVSWLWSSVFSPVFRLIGNIVAWAWNTLIRPVFNAINSVIRNLVAPVVRWLYNTIIKPTWDKIGAAIRFVWEKFISPAFNKIRDGVGKLGGYFSKGVEAIKTAWDKLRDAAKKPVAFVVNTVFNGGIVKLWNAVADLVPGVGKLSPIKGFATGGVMPGYAPGRDRLLAAVSPGESIFRPEFTRAVGEKFVTGANAAARSGGVSGVMRFLGLAGDPGAGPGFAGHFSIGGIVGGFLNAAKGWFAGGLVKTARKATDALTAQAQRAIGGTAFGDLAVNVARGLAGKILGFFGGVESKLGANAVVRAARSQLGVPYVWGGTAWGRGLDCSGLTSQAWLRGAGRWIGRTTYQQYPNSSPIGSPRPAALGFPHMGHVVLASKPGYLIEAPFTGARVREVPIRRHYQWRWPNAARGVKFDSGGMLQPGFTLAYNATRSPEPVLTAAQFDALSGAAAAGRSGPLVVIEKVVVEDRADVDMLMSQIEFRLRAAGLA